MSSPIKNFSVSLMERIPATLRTPTQRRETTSFPAWFAVHGTANVEACCIFVCLSAFATVGFNATGLRIKAVTVFPFLLFENVLFIHQVVDSKVGEISILDETIPFDSGWRIAQTLQKF